MNCEEQLHQCPVPDTMSSSTTSGHSVTLTTDSNESESPHHKPSSRPRGGNSSWLVTPPPCFTLGNTVSTSGGESNPLEDLLIEHPSMSVYGGSTSTSARGRPRHDTSQQQSQSGQQVANTAARPAVRACLSTRSEHYHLRKSTMQKSKASKKLNTKKAFQRQNHTAHFVPKNHNRQTVSRPVVFQPRK